jgi:hypothetical protein
MAAGISRPSPHAWAELNLLNLSRAVRLEGARFSRAGTVVYDLAGEPLFLRTPIEGGDDEAYADSAIDPRVGAPLLSVSQAEWDANALYQEAAETLRSRRRPVTFNDARFVAFSFPKVAIQFLRDGQEVALLELYTWRQVPPARKRKKNEPPGDFERWSFLNELPANAVTAKPPALHQARSRAREADSSAGAPRSPAHRRRSVRELHRPHRAPAQRHS